MKTVEEYVRELINVEGSFYKALRRLYESVRENRVNLTDPNPPTNFLQYLLRMDYSLWYWTVVLFVVVTLVSIALTSITPWIKPLRYVFGTIYVLFIPGYVLIEALYPREKDLKPLERMALSIGLSLAIIPLIGLLLNYTPWGIRLGPIITSTSVYVLVLLTLAAYRKYRIFLLKTREL